MPILDRHEIGSRPDTLPVAVVCVVALLDAAAQSIGVNEVSGMPTLPWWSSLVAGALVTLDDRRRRSPRQAWWLWGVAALLLALSSLPALPHDLLVVISSAIALVTGGGSFFEVGIPWLAVLRNLSVLAAAGVAGCMAVRARRTVKGLCRYCGRKRGDAARSGQAALWWPATVAVLAPVPYMWLKLAWSTGSSVGLADREYFEGVTLTTQGFGDTSLLGGIGMAAALAMAMRVDARAVRGTLVGIGAVGAIMLLPVGALGSLFLAMSAIGVMAPNDGSVIEPWAFTLVYVSFLAWGAGLSLTSWRYWRATRPRCARHSASP